MQIIAAPPSVGFVAYALLLVTGLLTACAQEPDGPKLDYALHRFEVVGTPATESGTRPLPLGGEIRESPSRHAETVTTVNRSAGPQQSYVPVPASFDGASRVLVAAAGAKTSHARRAQRVQRVLRVEPVLRNDAGESQVRIEFDGKLAAASWATVRLIRVPEPGDLTQETTSFVVPEQARLEFSFGVYNTFIGAPEVEFTLSLCEADRCVAEFAETRTVSKLLRWQDRSLPLAKYAGRKVSLRLTSRVVSMADDDAVVPLWTTPVLYGAAPSPAKRRNVILISLDTLSADHLDVYGYPHPTAPFMTAEFGQRGAVFENAVAASTVTGPSHMSMFTSALPSVHGLGATAKNVDPPLARKLLAELLHDSGFRTGAFTENAAIYSGDGFARGFDEYYEQKGRFALTKGYVREIFGRGTAWWKRHRGKPRFLFLHTYQVHGPYKPPRGYLRKVFGESPPGTNRHKYDAEIRNTDDALRDFFEELRREGDLENTVVMIVSDHGEEFGEHGYFGHGITLHSEMVHVPLMLSGEGIPAELRVATPVSHVDIMPTILDLAAVPVPPGLSGRSLLPFLEGDGDAPEEARPIYSEAWFPFGFRMNRVRVERKGPGLAVRVGDRKLVRYVTPRGTTHRYFDLTNDPAETTDLSGEPHVISDIAELSELLDNLIDPSINVTSLFNPRKTKTAPKHRAQSVDEAREAKLRALGYVE